MSGIIAQYGFAFQKRVFIKNLLEKVSAIKTFSFENVDDIDISKEDPICKVQDIDTVIQVKSGKPNLDCLYKIIGNWLLISSSQQDYILFTETSLDYDITSDIFIDGLIESIKNSNKCKGTKILKQVNDLFVVNDVLDENKLKMEIKAIVSKTKIENQSYDDITSDIKSNFISTYCSDIINFNLAKERRSEAFIDSIVAEIEKAMGNKKPYRLTYEGFIKLILDVKERYSDTKYEINLTAFKKGKESYAQELINQGKVSELKQLKYVYSKNEQIMMALIDKLLYEDFKTVYKSCVEVDNIESQAKYNHTEIVNDDENIQPKDLFNKTIERKLKNSKMPEGDMYSKGCYIYLTSDDAKDEYKIWWKKDE